MTKQASRLKLGRISISLALVFGTLALTAPASAQSPDLSAPELQTPSTAFTEALSAFDSAWSANGLAISTVTFTDGASTGYGKYSPKVGAAFAPGEAITLYAEPVGYAFAETGGNYSYEVSVSYKLLNPSGQVLSEQDDFARFAGTGRSKQRQLSASLSFQFDGLPVGAYQLQATFTDQFGGQTASFARPFSISGTN